MDLKTSYLGFELKSPLVVAANPLSDKIDNIKAMEDAGASAIVLYSLFEEQIIAEQHELHSSTVQGAETYAEATSYFPEAEEYRMGPEEYLEHIQNSKKAVNIPIIASLNGTSMGGWTEYAKKMQEAGADAIELNIYRIINDFNKTSLDIENEYIEILKAVKSSVNIPVSLKLSPYFTNIGNMAKKVDEAGVDAIILFNRFYQPDINLDELEVEPHIILSNSAAMRLPMRWIAMLKGNVKADLAATSGIQNGHDVIKMMMVGANAAMICSSILKYGINHIKVMEKEIVNWMEEKEYESIKQMQGSMSQKNVPNPANFERAQYMKALSSFTPVI